MVCRTCRACGRRLLRWLSADPESDFCSQLCEVVHGLGGYQRVAIRRPAEEARQQAFEGMMGDVVA